MIIDSGFRLGEDRMEILPTDQSDFPYACYRREMDQYIDRHFAWHWHPALEIEYVAEGGVEFRTADCRLQLKKGDAVFINANVVHDIRALNDRPGSVIYAHVFDMHFLSGMYNSLFEKKYMNPILRSRSVRIHRICGDSYEHIQMLEKLLRMVKLAGEEPAGYEFEIRAELGRFWHLLFEDTADKRAAEKPGSAMDEERLRRMMDYIQLHYMDRLTLKDIAAAAGTGTRECSRCFARCIGMSPVNYLIAYRVRMAARQLLTTEKSVMTIGEDCGFSSSSYFGKMFRQYMHCTPGEYRRDGGDGSYSR